MNFGDWDNVIGTNLTGMFLVSKYAARRMINHKKVKLLILAVSDLVYLDLTWQIMRHYY